MPLDQEWLQPYHNAVTNTYALLGSIDTDSGVEFRSDNPAEYLKGYGWKLLQHGSFRRTCRQRPEAIQNVLIAWCAHDYIDRYEPDYVKQALVRPFYRHCLREDPVSAFGRVMSAFARDGDFWRDFRVSVVRYVAWFFETPIANCVQYTKAPKSPFDYHEFGALAGGVRIYLADGYRQRVEELALVMSGCWNLRKMDDTGLIVYPTHDGRFSE